MMCQHHHNPSIAHFHYWKRNPCPLAILPHFSVVTLFPHQAPLPTINIFTHSIVCLHIRYPTCEIHIAACITTLFPFVSNNSLVIPMHRVLFMSMDFFLSIKNTVMNLYLDMSFMWMWVFTDVGFHPEVELPGCMGTLCLLFEGLWNTVPKMWHRLSLSLATSCRFWAFVLH